MLALTCSYAQLNGAGENTVSDCEYRALELRQYQDQDQDHDQRKISERALCTLS
jgi:hypothetical protein